MKNKGKVQIWKDYQKEIAEDHFFYVRSCIRQNFFPGSEQTFLKIMRIELQKDVFENPHHTSCSGIGYHSDIVPFETIQTIVARQFALMTEAGYRNLAVSCITSFGIYNEIIETWKEFPDELEKIRKFLKKATGREFDIPQNIAHASDIIYKFREDIGLKKLYPLVNRKTERPLKIVEHIGCHYSKMFPAKGVGGAEFPLDSGVSESAST
jgi:heterodisulfide reductase subunit B